MYVSVTNHAPIINASPSICILMDCWKQKSTSQTQNCMQYWHWQGFLTLPSPYFFLFVHNFFFSGIPFIDWWAHYKKLNSFIPTYKSVNAGKPGRVPDFVFLAHVVDVSAALHAPFVFRSFAALPFSTRLFLIPLWAPTLLVLLMMWAWSKTFLYSFYKLRGRLHQTWVVPRFGFQVCLITFQLSFFLPN